MQQHGSKNHARRAPLTPSPDPGGLKVKIQRFQNIVVANILPADPLFTPPDPGAGVKMSKFNFSDHFHGAYQIKWNHECSNMVANILSTDPPPPYSGGQKIINQLFQNIVMLHIKLNGITNAAT